MGLTSQAVCYCDSINFRTDITTITIIIIVIVWLVVWTLPFPRATSMPADFVLDGRQLSDQC